MNKHGRIYENSGINQAFPLHRPSLEIRAICITRLKGLLGSFVWSPDSSKIAYIAEAKQTNKEKSIYNSKVSQAGQNKSSENELITVNNYEQVGTFEWIAAYLRNG